MATKKIPDDTKIIRQANRGEVFGDIVESFNLDLNSNMGKILTARKMVKVLDEDDLLGGVPQAFEIYDGQYWLVTDDDVYSCSVTNDPTDADNWSRETAIDAGDAGFISDAVVFDDLLLISTDDNIISYNGSVDDVDWWTTVAGGTALTGGSPGVPHIMHVTRGGAETLFVTDGNLVRYYNVAAGHSTVELQPDLVATCVASGVSSVWVGTYTESGSNAYVYEILVGQTANATALAQNAFEIEGRSVLSIAVIDNVPYIVTEKGHIQGFTGQGFTTVASFPFAYTDETLDGVRPGQVQASNRSRPIHPKGMRAFNRSLFISINTTATRREGLSTIFDYAQKSANGVWEYNRDLNTLNHRFAFCETATDYGEKEGSGSGPLLVIDNQYTLLLAGGKTVSHNSGVFAENSAMNLGYFVTSEIESDSVADAFESVYLKAKTLQNDQTIALKYRTTKQDRQLFDGTFADSTTLNTTDDIIVAVGDEVSIINGTNSSYIAHVIAVTQTVGTISMTLDSAIGTTGETVRAEANNWQLHPTTYTPADGEYKRFGLSATAPWIQYKVVLNGNIEFRQLLSKSNNKIGL